MDVFALVKDFMHDNDLFQAPLLVLPGAFVDSVDRFFDNFNASAGASNHFLSEGLCAGMNAAGKSQARSVPSTTGGASNHKYQQTLLV